MNTHKIQKKAPAALHRVNTQENTGGFVFLLKCSLRGFAFSVVCGVVLIFISAAIAYSMQDPNTAAAIAGPCSAYIAAALGGFAASKKCKRSALLCGACTGGLMLISIHIIALFFGNYQGDIANSGMQFLLNIPVIVCAITGSILGLKSTVKKNIKRKK